MKRYLRLYISFLKNCLVRELEFRMNFALNSIMSFVWVGVTFATIEMIFGHVESLAGWSKESVILITIIYYVVDGILKITVENNVAEIPSYIRQGQLDGMLLRPMNTRFLVSLRYVNFGEISRAFVFAIVLIKYVFQLNPSLTILQFIYACVLMCLGMLGMYSFLFLISMIAFWKPGIWNLAHVSIRLRSLASFPSDIYQGAFRALVYILPTATFCTVPALFLLGKGDLLLSGYSFLLSLSFYFLSIYVWNRGLMRYESASS